MVPSNAAILRRRLGLENAACFDLNAACSGFVYALTVAESMIVASATASNRSDFKRALVVAGDARAALLIGPIVILVFFWAMVLVRLFWSTILAVRVF